MTHPRKAIRQAVHTLLAANLSVGSSKVFASRVVPLHPSELPAVLVYALSEQTEVFSAAPVQLKRNLQLAVEVVAQAVGDVDSALDDLAEEIENIMRTYEDLTGTCSDYKLDSTEITLDKEGEQLIGGMRMTYTVEYYTDEVPDASTLDAFETGQTDYVVQGGTGAPPAAGDTIHPEQ